MKMITIVKIIHFKYTAKGNFYQTVKYLRWKPNSYSYPDKTVRMNVAYNIPDEEAAIADFLYAKCRFHGIPFQHPDEIVDVLINKTPQTKTSAYGDYGRITDHSMSIVKNGMLKHVYTWKIEIIGEDNLCFIPAVILHTKNAAHDQTLLAVDGLSKNAKDAFDYIEHIIQPLAMDKHTDVLVMPMKNSKLIPEMYNKYASEWSDFLKAHAIHNDIDVVLESLE